MPGVTTLPAAVAGLVDEPETPANGANGTNGHGLVLEQDDEATGPQPLSAREVEVMRRLYRSGRAST